MKFTILGATGPTGILLVKECLDKGHDVTALVRNPDKLQVKHDKLNVNKVDIFNEKDLIPHMEGSDAVFSCLGAHPGFGTTTLYTDSIQAITAAMRAAGVRRFVGISSWATQPDPGLPFCIKWIYRPLYMRSVMPDMAAMEDYLSNNCKDLDFTVVRPSGLDDKKSTDAFTGSQTVGYEGQYVPDGILCIPRRDVANFMLRCVVNGEWKNKHVAISTGYKSTKPAK